MYKEETKFWHEIKAFVTKNNCKLSFTRLENSAAHGTPDVLGYNNSGHFFTIELKLKKAKKINFSPHQIAFHISHPKNTFIWVKTLPKALDPSSIKLYEGTGLAACSLGLCNPLSGRVLPSLRALYCLWPYVQSPIAR